MRVHVLVGRLILWLTLPAIREHFARLDTADARRLHRLDPADVARWPVR